MTYDVKYLFLFICHPNIFFGKVYVKIVSLFLNELAYLYSAIRVLIAQDFLGFIAFCV